MRVPSRRLAALAAGLLFTAAFAQPAFASASTTAQTTDAAGDGRVRLLIGDGSGIPFGPNQPLADILAAGARIDATSVTFFVRLGQAPTAAQLDNSNFRYGNTITIGNSITVVTDVFGYESLVYVYGPSANGGDGPLIVAGTLTSDTATGEVRYTVSRADFDSVLSDANSGVQTLTAGTNLQVTGATATALGVNPVVGNPSDTAAAGPVTTYTG